MNDNADDIDFVDYIQNQNILGCDIPRRITVNMDNKKMQLNIKALTSSQIRTARLNEEKGIGTFQENVVHMASYSLSGNQIPLEIIQNKIPAGIIDTLSNRIIKYSLYGE